MTKINGVRQRKGWVDTGRANAKLRKFSKPAVDVQALDVQVGPTTPKPGSRLKPEKKRVTLPAPAAVAADRSGPPRRGHRP